MSAVISDTVLVLAEPLGELSAERVAGALGKGLQDTGDRRLTADLLAVEEPPADPRARWGPGTQARMQAARAVVIATGRLDERTLAGSLAFEVATSARQGGVPAYAIAAENDLDLFDARMLDLQLVLEASSARALTAAGRKLAELV
jgi:glycerate kinase family protein